MLNPETPADSPVARGSPIRLWIAVGLGGLLLILAALAIWWWLDRTPPALALDDEEEDIAGVLAVVNPGYVGIESCAECHAKRAAVVKTTRHYLACTPATGVTAPGFTPGRGLYKTSVPGLRYEMTRSGDKFLATIAHATDKDEQRVSYEIGLVYGSAGKRDEMYFAWQDDRLHHLPVAWLFPADRWGHLVNTTRPGNTPPSCLECHNTWIAHIPGTPNQYRRDDMFLGVTCERCHGPGRDHVEHHRKHPTEEKAHAILHPGTLSRERLIDVCAQCHGNTRMLDRPFSYRPGEPLESYYRTIKAKLPEDDTTTDQVRYLAESKCFQKSNMTCITCHDPHRPRSAESGCLKCHTADSCPDQPHQPAAVRGDCVGCHMPTRIALNSHFYSTTDDQYLPVGHRSDHRIAVYPQAKQTVVLDWLRKQHDAKSRAEADRLATQLTEHWLNEAEQRRRANRLKAAIFAFREALQIAPNSNTRQRMQEVIRRQVKLDDLEKALAGAARRSPGEDIQLLTRILDMKPDDARTHSQLGAIYAMTGQREEAISHLQTVAKCDPNDSSGLTRLAWMASIDGRPEEAAALCAQADKIEREHPMNAYVWGMALAKQKRWADAEKQFRSTLRSNPTHGGANQGLSEALRQQGQAAEAVRFARRAVRWSDPENPEVLLTLADAYTAAKRVPDARKTLDQALAVANKANPALVPVIRDRLLKLP